MNYLIKENEMANPIKYLQIRRLKKERTEARRKMSNHDAQMYKAKAVDHNWNSSNSNYTLHKIEYNKWRDQYKKIKSKIAKLEGKKIIR